MKLKIPDAQKFVEEHSDQLAILSGIQKLLDDQLRPLIDTQKQSYSYNYYGLSINKTAPLPLTKRVDGQYIELSDYKIEPLQIHEVIISDESDSDKTTLLDEFYLLNTIEKEAIRTIIDLLFMESKNRQENGKTYYDITSCIVITNQEVRIVPYKKGFSYFNITNNPLDIEESSSGYFRERLDEFWFAELFSN
jgi:hypothetical protein